MRYEIEPTQFVIRLYEDERHPDTYYASALIRTYGDVGLVSSISSPRFLPWLMEHLNDVTRATGAKTFEGYMSKAMARACRMATHGKARYEETHMGGCAGREMPWVRVSALESDERPWSEWLSYFREDE